MREKVLKFLPLILTTLLFTFSMPMSVLAMSSFTYDTYQEFSEDDWYFRRYHHDNGWIMGVAKYYGSDQEVEVPSVCNITGGRTQVIDDETFKGNTSIENVIIPDGVQYIGDNAFNGCTNLKSITIPDSVISIGEGAFTNCSSLTEITIPDSVSVIEDDTFYGCSNLQSITFSDQVTSIGEGAFMKCSSLTDFVIPDGIKSIADTTFSGCSSLTNITIPADVTSIGECAFANCRSLTSFVIPDGITALSQGLFYGCSNLRDITIPDGVTSIGSLSWVEGVFSGCTSLTSINIPDGVTIIGYYAFKDCTGIKSITIPDSVTTIGDYAFKNCSGLTEITIPDGVTSIYKDAFTECVNIRKAYCPANCAYSICHFNEALEEVHITSGSSIPAKAFWAASNLSKVFIPASVTSIGQCSFISCPATIYYASSYKNWQKIKGIEDIEYVGNTVVYAIKDTPKVTAPTAKALSYTGKNQSLVKAGKTTGGTIKYSLKKNGTYSTVIPKAKNIGKYTVYYKVDGGARYKSTGVKAIAVKIVPKAVAISSVISKASKSMVVTWAKNSQATGYQIQYAVSAKFSGAKTATITKNSVVSKKITKLTKGKTYYVRVRSYKTVSGSKLYSAWSKSRKVKVAK